MQRVVDATSEFYVAVGKNIRAARLKSGLSQTMLAQRIGFTRASIANLEGGRQRIALHLFALIALALDVEPVELLPDTKILQISDKLGRDNLHRHLAGTSETTQDFVLRAVAQVAPAAPTRKDS